MSEVGSTNAYNVETETKRQFQEETLETAADWPQAHHQEAKDQSCRMGLDVVLKQFKAEREFG